MEIAAGRRGREGKAIKLSCLRVTMKSSYSGVVAAEWERDWDIGGFARIAAVRQCCLDSSQVGRIGREKSC